MRANPTASRKMPKTIKIPTLNVVDSSAWLSYFTGGEHASQFSGAIEDSKHLIVPVIVLYEVFKKVLRERGEQAALQIAGVMHSGKVVQIDASLVLDAARYPMPMADSLIYATAQRFGALVLTQDEDFKGLPGVRYFAPSAVKHNAKRGGKVA